MKNWQITFGLFSLALVGMSFAPNLREPHPEEIPAIAVSALTDEMPSTLPDDPAEEPIIAKSWLFHPRPQIPPAPRRLPTRPTECTQPPPGGAWQVKAIEHSRKHQCPQSLSAIREGMKRSIDHCTLLRTAWLCFNETDQRRLEDTEAETWDDLVLHTYHFEGTRESRESQAATSPELQQLPAWMHPAPSGVEFRLEAWSSDEQVQAMVADLFGSPTIADHLGKDLHLEALAAVGMARVPPEQRSGAMEQSWARRVYVLSRALSGSAGGLIEANRSDLLPVLRMLLGEATSDYVDASGHHTPIPADVQAALDVGLGNRSLTTLKASER